MPRFVLHTPLSYVTGIPDGRCPIVAERFISEAPEVTLFQQEAHSSPGVRVNHSPPSKMQSLPDEALLPGHVACNRVAFRSSDLFAGITDVACSVSGVLFTSVVAVALERDRPISADSPAYALINDDSGPGLTITVEMASQILRVGTFIRHEHTTDQAILRALRGVSGETSSNAFRRDTFWLSPLPRSDIRLILGWPALNLPPSQILLEKALLQEAAKHATAFWAQ